MKVTTLFTTCDRIINRTPTRKVAELDCVTICHVFEQKPILTRSTRAAYSQTP